MPGRRDRKRGAPAQPPAATLLAAALSAAALVAAVLLAGCGGSGGTTGAGTAGAGTTGAGAGSRPATGNGYRGTKGERIEAEAASALHISRADCEALRRRAEAQAGRRLALFAEPTSPSSRCRLTAAGATIGVYLDSGRSAHQRYLNRMVEQDQFGAPDPSRITHPVPHVGDPAPGNQNASWVPGLGSLFATRGNRWLTVTYSVGGVTSAQARARASVLARLGFRLSSR
ncbi:MAG TPA: hypothetical protein VGI73_05780 [Solirubrobacterales bacterium]